MQNRLSKHYVSPLLTIILLCLLITSCSGPTEIVFTHGPEDSGTLQQLVDDFNAQHKGDIKVTWQEGDRLSNEYYRELEKAFKSGTSDIDVLSADVVWTSTFADQGWVANLSQALFEQYETEDFLPAALNSASYQGQAWGVPWYTDLGILYYRKDLLQQQGFDSPPTTWTELAEMTAKIQNNLSVKHGYVFQGANYEGGVANVCEFIWNAGGQILFGDLSIDLDAPPASLLMVNSKEAIAGIESAQKLVSSGVAPKDVYTYKEAECLEAFKHGNAVFMRSWPTAYQQILASDSPINADQLGVAALPVHSPENNSYSCLGGWNLMVNASASAEEQAAAWTFIQFLTDEAQQRILARDGGHLPILQKLYEDEALLAKVPAMGLAKQVMPHARLRPVTPRYMEMAPDIAWAFSEVLQDNLSATVAVESIEGLFHADAVANRE
jgi:multiple sugar transport system substrate-binding protein